VSGSKKKKKKLQKKLSPTRIAETPTRGSGSPKKKKGKKTRKSPHAEKAGVMTPARRPGTSRLKDTKRVGDGKGKKNEEESTKPNFS